MTAITMTSSIRVIPAYTGVILLNRMLVNAVPARQPGRNLLSVLHPGSVLLFQVQ
jgi:hypothetical protein